ncbi:hypothetical protein KIPB_000195 [Kipferlia bialata]|uniref:Uncharacterized protein n=1 Tax=Kipferlia bialata TaxID=797122 RepID=A0A9K3GES4_9EUKA|nr:hypothetical protein KIPB_000195 [Kipferlia bialata]|eukprot:g195.t1
MPTLYQRWLFALFSDRFNYFKAHFYWYIFLALALGSVLFLLERSNPLSNSTWLDSVFHVTSGLCETGLTVDNFSAFRLSSQVVVILAVQLGSPVMMSVMPLCIRRWCIMVKHSAKERARAMMEREREREAERAEDAASEIEREKERQRGGEDDNGVVSSPPSPYETSRPGGASRYEYMSHPPDGEGGRGGESYAEWQRERMHEIAMARRWHKERERERDLWTISGMVRRIRASVSSFPSLSISVSGTESHLLASSSSIQLQSVQS